MLYAVVLFLLTCHPQDNGTNRPDPAQLETAREVAIENLRTELTKSKAETFYTSATTLVLTLLGSGGIARWWYGERLKLKSIEHRNEMEKMAAEHKQAIEMARVNAETKKTANDDELSELRTKFRELESHCRDEERKCSEKLATLTERLDGIRGELQGYREQLLILQAMRRRSSFAGWTVSFGERRIIDVTPAGERQILIPLGKRREQVERQLADTIWPPALAKLTMFLDEEARVRPGHIAAAMNVKVDPNLPLMMVAKVLATDGEGHAQGIEGIVIPMAAFVNLPDELAELRPKQLDPRT